MAGLRDLKKRIVSVQGIEKVTQAMGNIASAKFNGAWTRLQHARTLNSDLQKVVFSVCEEPEDVVLNPRFHVLGSDAGLCGSVNTLLVRHARKAHEAEVAKGANPTYFLSGNKIRVAMTKSSEVKGNIDMVVSDMYKSMSTAQIGTVADELSKLPASGQDVYMYQSMVTQNKFALQTDVVPSKKQIQAHFGVVEFEGDNDVYDNLVEYMSFLNLYRCHAEQEASELSSRAAAMQNASKAAGDMIDVLQLKYRKTRQEKMTTEIIEISTGAAAVMKD